MDPAYHAFDGNGEIKKIWLHLLKGYNLIWTH